MQFIRLSFLVFLLITSIITSAQSPPAQVIRVNQLGYLPSSIKVAVLGSGQQLSAPQEFRLVEVLSGKTVFKNTARIDYAEYGPFKSSFRLDFSKFNRAGSYYLEAAGVRSPIFTINTGAYRGSADFVLRYMRQQRCGFNPFLKDSCHTKDGFSIYGPMPKGTHIDATGGWHDASDYLQYSTTSANATYHLLAAYRDFPGAFGDQFSANGLRGKNGAPDVLDEAKWGLDWLLKMHPQSNWMFNQVADDRDHAGYRLPNRDSVDYGYGKGKGRPVYFVTGEPQVRGKFMNNTTGTSSTAGKFASAFALASQVLQKDSAAAQVYGKRALSAYEFGAAKPGAAQTASVKSPYIYAEDNWADDIELAAAAIFQATGQLKYYDEALSFSKLEPLTPWLGADTANHYQWYPFHNFGHYEIAVKSKGAERKKLIGFYRTGIEKVWQKAKGNAFYRGVPFIWCSNNLTASFAIQCYLYRKLSGDEQYAALEQATFDWLFGLNPWGTGMVVGLPARGDTPVDPHSSLTVLKRYPLDGGLVDGPVYDKIFSRLIGIQMHEADEYAAFQSPLAVYHDDNGDYSTNEPTMDGTASMVYLLAAKESESRKPDNNGATIDGNGALVRGNLLQKKIKLVFTGDEFADGGEIIRKTLARQGIKASFFFTGNFYANAAFAPLIRELKSDGHYLGAHSDKHLLYADWQKRDSLLVDHETFLTDLQHNYEKMEQFGIKKEDAGWFLPPYEWYNTKVAQWTNDLGLKLVNFSAGTRSAADYTYPEMGKSYLASDVIYKSILDKEAADPNGLNGFILLVHIGADPRRTDKFYNRLDELITTLKGKGYGFERMD